VAEENRMLEALQSLGLTEYEARAYVALVNNGTSIARDVSFFGHVPRTKTYGALRNLERKGLVHTVPGKPEVYTAVSPLEILMPLAEKLNAEADYARATVSSLSELYVMKKNEPQRELPVELNELWSVEGRRKFILERIVETIKHAKRSIDCRTTSAGLVRMYKAYADDLADARKRGVLVRVLTHLSSDSLSVAEELRQILDIKSSAGGITGSSIIVDRQSVITVSGKPDDFDVGDTQAVATWTNNKALAELYGSIFEQLWELTPRLTLQQIRHPERELPQRSL